MITVTDRRNVLHSVALSCTSKAEWFPVRRWGGELDELLLRRGRGGQCVSIPM